MTDANAEPIPKSTRLPRKVWISIIAGLAILIVLPFSLIHLRKQLTSVNETATDTVENRGTNDGDSPIEKKDADPEIPDSSPPVDSISLQQRALQQATLLRIRKQGNRIQQKWDDLSTAQNRLTLSLDALESEEVGNQIASSPKLIDQYVALRETAVPAADATAELQEELAILLEPLNAIEATQIQSEFTAALDGLAERIETQLIAVKRDQRMLEALQSVAASRAPAESRLADAVEQRAEALAAARLTEIADAVDTARQLEIDRVAKESGEEQRKIAEAERDVERLKEQQRLADLEAQKQQRQAAIAKAALEREFQRDLPQIRSLLRPLITDGLTQPGRNNFEPADKKGPVSLAKLRGTGALAPTAKARGGLYYIVGSNNDRDLGSFPRYRGGAQDVQSRQSTMMRVQELVNKYGELMVEKGMLAE
jgi:hypothetical protein